MDERPSPEGTRRPGIRSRSMVLADGHAWGFALPAPRIRPRIAVELDSIGRPVEVVTVESAVGYPIEIRRLVSGLQAACERDDEEQRCSSLIRLASALLRRAHEIDATTAASLLELDLEELPRLVEFLLSVLSANPSAKDDLDE